MVSKGLPIRKLLNSVYSLITKVKPKEVIFPFAKIVHFQRFHCVRAIVLLLNGMRSIYQFISCSRNFFDVKVVTFPRKAVQCLFLQNSISNFWNNTAGVRDTAFTEVWAVRNDENNPMRVELHRLVLSDKWTSGGNMAR